MQQVCAHALRVEKEVALVVRFTFHPEWPPALTLQNLNTNT